MERQLIGRGVLAGAVAGMLMFAFSRIFAEPIIVKSIAYEAAHAAASDGPALVSRGVQMNLGLGAGLILFGAAMGALVAVAYVIAIGRIDLRPFVLAIWVPVFFFIGIYLVPFLKYPANPPAVSKDDTVRERGASYLVLVFCSCLFLFLAVYVGQKLHRQWSLYATVIAMGAAYIAVMAALFALLPSFDEVPVDFPAALLADFRLYSLASQVVLWGGIALIFAPLATRVLEPVLEPA